MSVVYVTVLRSDVGQCPRNVSMLPDFSLMSGEARGMFICLCIVIIYMYLLICFDVYQALLDARRGPMKRERPMICYYVII